MHAILRVLLVPVVLSLAACGKADTAADAGAGGASAGGDAVASTTGTSDRKLPPTVEKALAGYVAICTEVGGKPDSTDGITRADLTADGVIDYVLNGHDIRCEGAASVWGDRAKGVGVFVGDGKGDAAPAFDDLTWGATIEGEGKDAKLWLNVSGEACGKPRAKDFASENFCGRQILWNGTTGKFDYAPVSTIRMIQ